MVSARGESSISAASRSAVLQTGAATVEADQRGSWPRAGGKTLGFIAVALHAALIGGRTYRVASSRSAATNCSVSGATTGWVLLSGAEQAKFTDAFDAAFIGAVITIVRPPMRAPRANVFAERWIGPGRECLSRTT